LLRDEGLLDVGADAFFTMTGAACNLLEQATMGLLDLATSPMISARGRKPA
jgi:hypothetical protein